MKKKIDKQLYIEDGIVKPKCCRSCQYQEWDEYGTKLNYCLITGVTLTCREDSKPDDCPLDNKPLDDED